MTIVIRFSRQGKSTDHFLPIPWESISRQYLSSWCLCSSIPPFWWENCFLKAELTRQELRQSPWTDWSANVVQSLFEQKTELLVLTRINEDEDGRRQSPVLLSWVLRFLVTKEKYLMQTLVWNSCVSTLTFWIENSSFVVLLVFGDTTEGQKENRRGEVDRKRMGDTLWFLHWLLFSHSVTRIESVFKVRTWQWRQRWDARRSKFPKQEDEDAFKMRRESCQPCLLPLRDLPRYVQSIRCPKRRGRSPFGHTKFLFFFLRFLFHCFHLILSVEIVLVFFLFSQEKGNHLQVSL